jgi:hypothetical protein
MNACTAVEMLMEHAEKRPAAWTTGSVVCAGILLAAYDGGRWIARIDELTLVDRSLREAALAVIRARAINDTEPQNLITDGDSRFEALAATWTGHPRVDRLAQTANAD